MKLVTILLAASLGSAFKLRGLANDTIQQQLSLNVTQEKDAGYYSRITNGYPALHDQFRYQVGLRVFYPTLIGVCSGSLLSNQWVLTAAHCLENLLRLDVHIGGIIFDRPHVFFPDLPKDRIKKHDDFNINTFHHDIAVLRIPPILFTDYIHEVFLPPHNFHVETGIYATFAGWGKTTDISDVYSPHLLYGNFKIISNEDCAEVYISGTIYDGKICTGTTDQISGCAGDSGGALVLVDRHMQIGIGSFVSALGCEKGAPNAFTRVSKYLDWIHRHTGLPV